MQDLNPDMDQVFKEAADKYPLKTNPADWKAISQKLHANENNSKHGIDNSITYSERKWIVLFLLLLIPMGWITTQYFKVQKKQMQTVTKVEDKQVKSLDLNKIRNMIDKFQPDKQVNIEIYPKTNKPLSNEDYSWQKKINNIPDLQKNKAEEQKNLIIASLLKNEKEHNDLNNFYLPEHLNNGIVKSKPTVLLENSNSNLSKNIQNINASAESNTVSSKKSSNQTNSKLKRFYIGAVIAPEFTSVKFQPVKRIGFNLGVLMGYSLSDKIGLELGATLAHKYYYTNGKYIAPNSIRRDNSTILNVDAFSSITEMPLTLQYTLKKEKNRRFFVSAGCVSYVIHKEHFNYTYTKNGIEKQSRRYYNKASNNWFSNAQVSVGYEYNVNKIGNITIEPYYRIPLKGIGISDVPITSIGINFALTKNLK